MNFVTVVFYALSALLLISGFKVVTTRHPVHAALFLVLSFLSGAGIWLTLQAEFLGIALILVYVGAVMVLFLFVLMMLEFNFEKLRGGMRGYWPMAALAGLVMAVFLISMIWANRDSAAHWGGLKHLPANTENVRMIGLLIYTEYVYPFILAAVLLLLAIVAAIALTLRERKQTKYLDPARQIAVQAADRVRVIKLDAKARVTAPSNVDKAE